MKTKTKKQTKQPKQTNKITHAKTISIGYYRVSDGDFAILATLNNNDGLLGYSQFRFLIEHILDFLQISVDEPIILFHRQDAPDYVNIENNIKD